MVNGKVIFQMKGTVKAQTMQLYQATDIFLTIFIYECNDKSVYTKTTLW